MASGTIYMTTDASQWSARLVWSSTAYQSSNRSLVNFKFQVYRNVGGSESYTQNYETCLFASYTDEFRGVSPYIDSRSVAVSPKTWTTIVGWNLYFSHNDSGSRSIAIASSIECNSFYAYAGGSGSPVWITLDRIPQNAQVKSAPNFTDEENPTITYSVPTPSTTSLLEACISLTGDADDIPYRDISPNETSYTFELTDAERATLRNATLNGSNSRKVFFYVRSTVNGSTSTHRLEKTFTVVNANPELSVFLMDANEKTVALTGDRLAVLVKGYSDVAYEMNAAGLKGASIANYSAVNGDTILTSSNGTFSAVNTGHFKLSATDNRGLTTAKEFTLNVIDYWRPTCNQEARIELVEETEASVAMEISGEFFNESFGAENNDVEVYIRHKIGDGEYVDWVRVKDVIWEINKNGNTFSTQGAISGLPYDEPITVQSKVVDKLEEAITSEYTLKLIPVFDWSETDFNFNVPVHFQNGFTVGDGDGGMFDYIIEQGTEPMGTNGTWYWSKWKNGKAECYGMRNYGNMACSTSWGNVYASSDFTQALPSGLFSEPPQVIDMRVVDTTSHQVSIASAYEGYSATSTGKFCIFRPTAATVQQVKIGFNVIGRWK